MAREHSYRPKPGVLRAFSGRAVPKGAIIICTYLVGMTGIAAGAFAMRGQIFNVPDPTTEIAASLPMPAPLIATEISPTFGTMPRHLSVTPNTPRLASLTPPATQLDENLLSPLSRIFLGQPSVTPPDRPRRGEPQVVDPEADITVDDTETTDPESLVEDDGILRTSLRPQLRPDNLRTKPTETPENVQVASLATPGSIENTVPQARPSVPEISARQGTCPRRLARSFPRRPGSAPGAQTFLANVTGIDGVKRDQHVAREILRGNMPGFLHKLVPVNITGKTANGTNAQITICVTPDYLALGSNRDYVRVPLGLSAAARIADQFGMILPTPRMVDRIYRASTLRLSPQPMAPGPQMTSTAYFVRHNATVEAQRRNAGAAPGTLISGHKKDVVLTSRLTSNRGRVAIYGWHRRNGTPIQPLSTVHGAGYADYSHGIRLVSRTAFLNGRSIDLRSLMADPQYAALLSHEGPVGRRVLASN